MRATRIIALLLALCPLFGIVPANAQERGVTVGLQPSSDSELDSLSATAFGISLAGWLSKNEDVKSLPEGPYVPTFAALHGALDSQTQMWRELREKDEIQHPYMDELVAVSDSGYLSEYIWHFYQSEDWGDPMPDLDMAAFRSWAESHLSESHPRQEAQIIIVNK